MWSIVIKVNMLYPDRPASWRLNPVLMPRLVNNIKENRLTAKKIRRNDIFKYIGSKTRKTVANIFLYVCIPFTWTKTKSYKHLV